LSSSVYIRVADSYVSWALAVFDRRLVTHMWPAATGPSSRAMLSAHASIALQSRKSPSGSNARPAGLALIARSVQAR